MRSSKIKSISIKLLSLVFVMVLAVSCGVLSGCEGEERSAVETTANQIEETTVETITYETPDIPDNAINVEIDIEEYGKISVALYPDYAPITVDNFVKLVEDGFYDGLTLHRIIADFMIQGGDPLGNGTGGSDEEIKGEFYSNGVANTLSHTRGAISMARSQMPDSASSQFFIVHKDSTFLDGQYAAFGYVTEGIEVVDAICEAVPVTDGNGTVTANKTSATEGTEIKLTVTPAAGYKLDTIKVDGKAISGTSFTMPATDAAVKVTFKKDVYTITAKTTTNGTIKVTPTTAEMGTLITVTITPSTGYELTDVNILQGTDTVAGVSSDGNVYTFTMPAGKVTIGATFTKIPE